MDLLAVLNQGVKERIFSDDKSQIGCLSGSNALLFSDGLFEAESSDHCPRVAMMRRVGGIQEPKETKSFISNYHGRTFEDFLKTLLVDVDFAEEEEVEVTLEDDKGNKLLTARPDKVIKHDGVLYPVEVKTIQSNTTAYSVVVKEKPKLGALIQLAIYMIGHNAPNAFLLYCASNWFNGFYGKTRWSVEPQFKVFSVELKDKDFFYEGKRSIVTVDKIIQGSYEFLRHKEANKVPRIPQWVDINGDAPSYEGCKYCFMKDVCESNNVTELDEFFNIARGVLNENQ